MSDKTLDTIERVEALLAKMADERARCQQAASIIASALEEAAALIRAAEQALAATER